MTNPCKTHAVDFVTRHSSFVIRHLLPLLVLAALPLSAAEPFLEPGDVIALVGGEDMVVAAELGYLELLLTRALPEHRLKFRSLAWEGDTVFEQRRDLNFPSWEEQLEQIGATVVICQFGQMESLAGKEKLPEFITAYEKLIERFRQGGKRRVVLVEPTDFPPEKVAPIPTPGLSFAPVVEPSKKGRILDDYIVAVRDLAQRHRFPFIDPTRDDSSRITYAKRDGVHLADEGQAMVAGYIFAGLRGRAGDGEIIGDLIGSDNPPAESPRWAVIDKIRDSIVAKNRLWFDYWRVQNWAFLAGDRTVQPSSRDHRDPSKRWFPAEREEFLPLIAAKEAEIWRLASDLAKP